MVEKYLLYVGRDWLYHGNGFAAHVRVNFGKGAYREGENYDHPDGAFGLEDGLEAFVDKPR